MVARAESGNGQDVLDLGIDPNIGTTKKAARRCTARRTRAATKSSRCWWTMAAISTAHDNGSRDTVNGAMKGMTWVPLHYSQGLVRVGVQSAIRASGDGGVHQEADDGQGPADSARYHVVDLPDQGR